MALSRGVLRVALPAALAITVGCAAERAALPAGSGLEPLPVLPLRAPDEFDRATRALASAVLLDEPAGAEAARNRIEALDEDRLRSGEAPSGLAPYAADAVNATERDALRFRAAQEALLDRDDTPEPLRRRLETELRDDPLALADARIADARRTRLGRLLNATTRALGTSLSNPTLLPYRLVTGLLGIGLSMRVEDELLPPERQALRHWKAFVEQNPSSPEAAALLDEIEEAQRRWLETQRARSVRRGRRALELRQPATARLLAERALRYAPEDPDAAAVRDEAQREIERRHADRARSLTARPTADARQERVLALALLLPDANVAGKARGLETAAHGGPLADEAGFARALAQADTGEERESWRALERLADVDPARSNMSRHAAALYVSSRENPARTFRAARRTALRRHFQALALGPLAAGPPDRDLPRPVEWLVAIPRLPAVVVGLPMRLISFPFQRPDRKEPAVFARRYLERLPEGEEAESLRDWLIDYERNRGNAVAALRLAQSAPDAEPEALAELRDEASQQALAIAKAERRYEARIGLLLEVARRFPESEAAREAGLLVREEAGRSSAQRIRIARSFLLENPVVAGPQGFALKPALLDGERENGELHAEGMTLLGGDAVEFAYLGPGRGSDDPPERRRERISPERIARGVAQLEETSARLLRTDRDLEFEPDAGRDLFFERARLGVAGTADPRPEARSSYAYIGTREKFGVVRGREAILPVEIVLQGSFEDFGLGAFPRIRLPKPTPDQILYR
ncbi:MAG: hypothetical protein ABFS41_04190 [Myxococcota bacterium]